MTKEALSAGKCVVIGLQSTGDSRTRQMIQRQFGEEEEDASDSVRIVPGFISSPKEVLLQLLDHAFPQLQLPDAVPSTQNESEDASLRRSGREC